MGYSITLFMFDGEIVLLEFTKPSGSPPGWQIYCSYNFQSHVVSYNLKRLYAEILFELFYSLDYHKTFLFSDGVLLFMLIVSFASTGYYSLPSIISFLMQNSSYTST